MSEYDERCGSCAAFSRVSEHPELGKVGECTLEIHPPPLRATATCTRYRPKGALAAAPRPRAAGEPYSSRHGRRRGSRTPNFSPSEPSRKPLPQEIDIDMDIDEFRNVLKQVLAEEIGLSDVPLGSRWQGGELVLNPGNSDTQSKSVPIDTFFNKIVMIRDKLRVLEAKINGHKALSNEEKVQMQSYITNCYGSLTTFNVLFADREDQFSTKR